MRTQSAKRRPTPTKRVEKRRTRKTTAARSDAPAARTLEGAIVKLAESQRLQRAARIEIKKQLTDNLPIVYQRGQKIVRHNPDGTEEILENISRPRFTLKRNVAKIVGTKRRKQIKRTKREN